jgi:hypothetical protein
MILVDTGFESLAEDQPVPSEDLEFVTTLVSNLANLSVLPEAVDRWWRDLTGVSARLELIADDRRLFAPHVLDRLARLDADTWSINSAFVGFRRGSPAARREAIEMVTRSSVLSH